MEIHNACPKRACERLGVEGVDLAGNLAPYPCLRVINSTTSSRVQLSISARVPRHTGAGPLWWASCNSRCECSSIVTKDFLLHRKRDKISSAISGAYKLQFCKESTCQ